MSAAPSSASTTAAIALLPSELNARLEAGRTAERDGQRDVARQHFEEVLRRLHHPSQAPLAAALLRWIARTHVDDADVEAALDCLAAALAIAEAIGSRAAAAHAINLMAIAHWQCGRLDEAERMYVEARGRARDAQETKLCAMIEQNLGVIASIRGDLDGALLHYETSLASYRCLGLNGYVSKVLNNLGMLHTELKNWRAAETAFLDALESCQEGGDQTTRVMIEVNRAGFWIAQRRFARARESCNVARELAGRGGDERALAEIHKHAGVVARELGEYEQAEEHLRRARHMAEGRQDLLLAAETAREQADLYWLQKRNRETLQYLNDAHRLFEQLRASRALADVDRRMGHLEATFLDIVRGWSDSIESKDAYTRGHCDRVAEYACALAAASGIDGHTLLWFRMGALLHDVGKIVVPSEILNKPGTLSPEERAIMTRHPEAGEQMLRDIEFPWDIRPMVRHHHERWDGTGYPDRLAGGAIPLAARILCIADVYDALTSDRPYRPAFSHAQAMQVMGDDSSRVFDPELFLGFRRLCEGERGWPIPAVAAPDEGESCGERSLAWSA